MAGLGNSVDASTTGFQSLNAATGVWNGRTLTAGTGISITNGTGTGGNPTIAALGTGSVSFLASKSANTPNATGDGTVVTMIYDAVSFNIGAGYNNATGVFTVPTTGKYYFEWCIALTTFAAANTTMQSFLRINGVVQIVGTTLNPFASRELSTGSINTVGACFLSLTSGNTIDTQVTVSAVTKGVVIAGGATFNTHFSGFLVA